MEVLCGRWLALSTSTLLLMVAGGSGFLFPVYSKAMETSLGYDHKSIIMLAVFKNVGASLGFLPSGLIYDVAPPRAVLPSAAAVNLLAVLPYLMPYLAAAGRTARPPVWLLCIYLGLGATAQSFAVTGALVGSVKNFPDHRGPVLTVLLAFAGLGGDISAQICRAFDGAAALMLFMVCLSAVQLFFACTGILVVNPLNAAAGPARSAVEEERRGVMRFLGVSVLVAVCLLILHVVDLAVAKIPTPVYCGAAIFLLAVLVISLLVVAMKQESRAATPTISSGDGEASAPVSSPSSPMVLSVSSNNPTPTTSPCLREILRAVFSVEMMLIFVVTFAIAAVQTPIDMIYQIGESLGYKHGTTAKLVSLVGLLDFAGRLAGGFVSEYMFTRYSRVPRPSMVAVTFLLACLGHLLIALDVASGLYVGSVVFGFCLGALWTVVFLMISDRFSPTLYSLAVLPSAAASYVLDVHVTGRLYDRELQRQQGLSLTTKTNCVGAHCFRESSFILAGLDLFGAAAVSAVLVWRFYRAPMPAAGVAPATTDGMCSSSEEEMAV